VRVIKMSKNLRLVTHRFQTSFQTIKLWEWILMKQEIRLASQVLDPEIKLFKDLLRLSIKKDKKTRKKMFMMIKNLIILLIRILKIHFHLEKLRLLLKNLDLVNKKKIFWELVIQISSNKYPSLIIFNLKSFTYRG